MAININFTKFSAYYAENLVKFECVVFDMQVDRRVDRLTYGPTHCNVLHPHRPPGME